MYFMGRIGNGIKATRSVFHSCLRISWAHSGCFHALEHCPKTSWARCLPVTVWNSLCRGSLPFYLQMLILKAQSRRKQLHKGGSNHQGWFYFSRILWWHQALFLDWFFVIAESWKCLFLWMTKKSKTPKN